MIAMVATPAIPRSPADGHQYNKSCLADSISSEADVVWCQVNYRADDDTAAFNDHMYHGGNPNKDPSGLCSDYTHEREKAGR